MSLPDKSRYRVLEVAKEFASANGCSKTAARMRIYRAIEKGDIVAIKILGGFVLEREVAEKIIQGERYV